MLDQPALFYRSLFEQTPNAVSYQVLLFDAQHKPVDYAVLAMNQAARALFQLTESEAEQKKFSDAYNLDDVQGQSLFQTIADAALQAKRLTMETYAPIVNKWLRITVFPVKEHCFGLVYIDISQEVESFLSVNLDMLCVTSIDGNFLKVNAAFEEVLGYPVQELEGLNFFALVHRDDRKRLHEVARQVAEKSAVVGFAVRCRCKNGRYKHLEWRSRSWGAYLYASARDITEKTRLEKKLRRANEELTALMKSLQASNERLGQMANVDELTGAYNRHFFDAQMPVCMSRAERYGEPLALALFDLDRFKKVNDKWGHPIGDAVLKKTAQTVLTLLRSSDMLIRLGGEEFAVLMPQTTLEHAQVATEKLRIALAQTVHEHAGHVTASFGIAAYLAAESFQHWYKRADAALYRAKTGGRNRVVVSGADEILPLALVCVEWRDEWASGDAEIDEQHQELLALGNQFLLKIFSDLGAKAYEPIMEHCLAALEHHFSEEEKKLAALAYPELDAHKAEHRRLIGQAKRVKLALESGEAHPTTAFSFLMDDVVIGHMLKSDTKYFGYLKKDDIVLLH